MPIIQSAIKRVRQERRRRDRNNVVRRKYKTLVKEYEALIAEKKLDEAKKQLPQVQKAIDLATKKNLLHQKTAGRRKSKLAKMLAKG